MVPEPFRVVRVEAHCFPDPLDAFFRSAQPSIQLALLHNDQVIVGIEAECTLLMVFCSLMIAAGQVHGRQDAVHIAILVVERERNLEFLIDSLPGSITVGAPLVNPGLTNNAGAPSMRMRIVWVESQGAFDGLLRFEIILSRRTMVKHFGGKDEFVGSHALGRISANA